MFKNYKKDRFGLYLLSCENIEDEIEKCLATYDNDLLITPKQLDIEDFAENFLGLNLEFHTLSDDLSVYGAFIFNKGLVNVYDDKIERKIIVKEKTIIIDPILNDKSEEVFRYTLGHEVAHYLCQYELRINGLKLDISNNMNLAIISYHNRFCKKRKLRTKEDWEEWQANYASGCLLMNRKAVLNLVSKVLGYSVEYKSGFLNNLSSLTCYLLAYEVKRTFNVSLSAAKIRLKQLS